MLILALDSATATARVAVLDDAGRARAERAATAARHSSNLLRLCHEVLEESGVAPAGLSAVACGAGPGSFTGLRVGLAVAKGLAMPTGVPLLLVPSLAALALDIFDAVFADVSSTSGPAAETLAAACIDAGKGAVHLALFRQAGDDLVAPVGDSALVLPEQVAAALASSAAGRPVAIAGNGADRYASALDIAVESRPDWRRISVGGPSAIAVGRLALVRRRRGEADDLEIAVPLYGRAPDITVKKTPPK
jgi:tRNA threonylcarbamoyladenosine biosynthesis protein TsaB